jgi:hypothetical protein
MSIVWLVLGSVAFALPPFAAIWVLAGFSRQPVLGGPEQGLPWRVRIADPIVARISYRTELIYSQILARAARRRRHDRPSTSTKPDAAPAAAAMPSVRLSEARDTLTATGAAAKVEAGVAPTGNAGSAGEITAGDTGSTS